MLWYSKALSLANVAGHSSHSSLSPRCSADLWRLSENLFEKDLSHLSHSTLRTQPSEEWTCSSWRSLCANLAKVSPQMEHPYFSFISKGSWKRSSSLMFLVAVFLFLLMVDFLSANFSLFFIPHSAIRCLWASLASLSSTSISYNFSHWDSALLRWPLRDFPCHLHPLQLTFTFARVEVAIPGGLFVDAGRRNETKL